MRKADCDSAAWWEKMRLIYLIFRRSIDVSRDGVLQCSNQAPRQVLIACMHSSCVVQPSLDVLDSTSALLHTSGQAFC